MAKKTSIPNRILEALAEHGDATTDTLAKRVGANARSISSACSRLRRAGKLTRADGREGAGSEAVWTLPKAS